MKLSIVLFCILAFFAVDISYFLIAPLNQKKPFVVEIREGSSAGDIIQTLKQEGITSKPIYFKFLIKFMGIESKLQAGYYEFELPVSPKRFLDLVLSGDVEVFKLTIVEGTTWHDLAKKINGLKHLQKPELKALPYIQSLKTEFGTLDGLFYPDTYYYHRGDNPVDILTKAHDKMTRKLEKLWSTRETHLPYKTPQEALVAASIIEKESADSYERELISHIMVERLKRHMKLQLDPTVVYAQKADDENFTKINTKFDSPYNTYMYHGLPPGPICFPSSDALKAAMHPKQNEFLYFVSDGKGKHFFATSFKEHQKNVKKLKNLLKNPTNMADKEHVL